MIIHLRTKDPFMVGLKVQGTLSIEGTPQSEYFASSPVPTNEGESHRLSLTIVGQPEEVALSLIGATSHPSFPNISIFSLESEDAAKIEPLDQERDTYMNQSSNINQLKRQAQPARQSSYRRPFWQRHRQSILRSLEITPHTLVLHGADFAQALYQNAVRKYKQELQSVSDTSQETEMLS
ncbi:hypothetical protein [Tengunoibacter tsumagoiensis]|uniref:Uncharacterized protein n=1 Tax=Tengunoibacter tsumagoiensis TaxID=2014871 RepID=A0A402A020_9CHLR|nr:hypothetical protein [Tengunoibacter tsumagoiensis]GCE12454.1 hypothetical protein KTT_23130 [Tengunoibacter tsumagoiensis]